MLDEVIIQSPAKLNLHLLVHPKRDDGYHDIESIFQAIDFFDELTLTKAAELATCKVETNSTELPQENTLTHAYREFCKYTGIETGVHVKLDKQIFSGAGLGGGSSDGAALIHALDVMFHCNLSIEDKLYLALKVGSDVPFFIQGGAAIVSGRGEKIRQIESRDDLHFVVIMPDVHSSTKEAFTAFDEQKDKEKTLALVTLHEAEDVYRGPVADWSFTNSFTDLLVKQHKCIGDALIALKNTGALFSQMSGSGAAVYGVFDNEEDAKKAYTKLSIEWECRLAKPYSIHHW